MVYFFQCHRLSFLLPSFHYLHLSGHSLLQTNPLHLLFELIIIISRSSIVFLERSAQILPFLFCYFEIYFLFYNRSHLQQEPFHLPFQIQSYYLLCDHTLFLLLPFFVSLSCGAYKLPILMFIFLLVLIFIHSISYFFVSLLISMRGGVDLFLYQFIRLLFLSYSSSLQIHTCLFLCFPVGPNVFHLDIRGFLS